MEQYPGKDPRRRHWDRRDIAHEACVGVLGWQRTNMVVIDRSGLTDRIIGRMPLSIAPLDRRMAHDRSGIPEYVNCLRIGVPRSPLKEGVPKLKDVPLKDEEIIRCQSKRWY